MSEGQPFSGVKWVNWCGARSADGKGMTSTAPCATVVEGEICQAETGTVQTEKGKTMRHPMEDFESANLSTGEFEPHRGPTDRYMFDCEHCLNKEIIDGATFCIPLRARRDPLKVEETEQGWRLVCHEYQPGQI